MIQMFDLDFMNNLWQALRDNLSPVELTSCNYMTHLLCQAKYLLGTIKMDQYSLVEASRKKWLENESDPDDHEYKLPILKYDANQDALV
jgi:hypothetical protein